jgi:hypothetical protein
MKKTIKVKYDKKTKERYFDIKDFKDIVDVKKIHGYKMEFLNEGIIALTFYGKDSEQIIPKDKKDEKSKVKKQPKKAKTKRKPTGGGLR